MFPSLWVFGSLVRDAEIAVLTHNATDGTVICRLHRPIWMTTGMLVPTGGLVRVKLPSEAEVVLTIAMPERDTEQVMHETPGLKTLTESWGM